MILIAKFPLNLCSRIRSNQNTQRARSAPVKVAILISNVGALAVAVLVTTVPRA